MHVDRLRYLVQGRMYTDIDAAREIAYAAPALLAQLEERGWQPIYTAPRDGTDILLACWTLHDAPEGPFMDCIVAAWDVEEVGGEGGWATDNGLSPIEGAPTHWMKLPAPPPR